MYKNNATHLLQYHLRQFMLSTKYLDAAPFSVVQKTEESLTARFIGQVLLYRWASARQI